MNKFTRFAIILLYIIKFIAILILHLLNFILTLIPTLFIELNKLINKRLRFSITFKTTAAHTLIFSTILLLLGIAITCGFCFFLLNQTNQSLDNNSRVIGSLLSCST